MKLPTPILILTAIGCATVAAQDKKTTGYNDTPFLPGDQWRVHDDARPRPLVVTPGKTAKDAPSDAIILFDGTDLSAWVSSKGSEAQWTVENGFFEVPAKSSGKGGPIETKQAFGDFQLHLEWASPAQVKSNSQGRGNSGIFIMGKYELQVLDSFENPTYADGQASALYGYKPPLVNVSRGPGKWQTYDIIFEAPKWSPKGKLLKKAYITVLHNGILTHHRQPYLGETSHRKVAKYRQHTEKLPIKLQDHSNPVRYRNIWIRDLDPETHE